MCLIVFAYKTHPKYKLILAANRDEFYSRPTARADWWDDHAHLLGGRDLEAKGTWMAVNKRGRFAAVTNYRDLSNIRTNAKSRGDLPVDFLLGKANSEEYARKVLPSGDHYNGFNLLTMDDEMTHISNYENKVNTLEAGVFGLSNALLNTSWPKVELAKAEFRETINGNFALESLISIMQNQNIAVDDQLPETGLPIEMERAVSAMCIRTPDYGTCCSTAITIDYNGTVSFLEKSYSVGGRKEEEVHFSFNVEPQ